MLGFSFFIFMYLLGNNLSQRFSLPIPGAIIGLAFVFVVLLLRRKIDEPLKDASNTLLRYLALMLVPIGVGVIKLIDTPPKGIFGLFMVLIISLVVGSMLTAKLTQWLLAQRLMKNPNKEACCEVVSTRSPK